MPNFPVVVTTEERNEFYARLGYVQTGWMRMDEHGNQIFYASPEEINSDIIDRIVKGDLSLTFEACMPPTPAPVHITNLIEGNPPNVKEDDDIPF